jgi:hypothetical protein
VDRDVAALLEGEGVLIDPVGAILAVVILDIILNGDADPLLIIAGLTVRLGTGSLIGGVGGALLGLFLKQAKFLSDDLRNLVVLASVWGLYGLAQEIQGESGLMTAVVAGIVLRALSVPDQRLLLRFKGQLTIFAVSVLFILLAADLSIASVFALGQGALFTVLVLMLIVRPLNIAACTASSDLNWRQKAFLSWVAPRGIVSASVASLFSILLTERSISGGDAIKALVFLTILMTVLIQGLSAAGVANLLGLTGQKNSNGAVIVGCNSLSMLIARLYREAGETVTLIDTKPAARDRAAREDLPILINSALDEEVLEQAGIQQSQTLLVMTHNGDVNALVAQQAQDAFQLPRIVSVVPEQSEENAGVPPPNSNKKAASVQKTASPKAVFPKIPLKAWNGYLEAGAVRLGETNLRGEDTQLQRLHLRSLIQNRVLLPLLIERDNRRWVSLVEEESWKVGDRLIYLFYDPKPKLLQRLSGGSRPAKLAIETISEVETVLPPVLEPEPHPDELPETLTPAISSSAEKPELTSAMEARSNTSETTDPEAPSQVHPNPQESSPSNLHTHDA